MLRYASRLALGLLGPLSLALVGCGPTVVHRVYPQPAYVAPYSSPTVVHHVYGGYAPPVVVHHVYGGSGYVRRSYVRPAPVIVHHTTIVRSGSFGRSGRFGH